MRLIDADRLLEEIKELKIVLNGKQIFFDDTKETILRIIDEQPTAYDIGKVAEKLEEKRKESILFQHEAELQGSIVNENYFGGKRNAYAEAIEIVKQPTE